VNIAERALPPLPPFDDLPRMAARVQSMVKLALISLATRDVCVASQVLGMDALVDELHRDAFRHHEELMRADPDTVERAVLTLSSSRHLERVGDHAKNIAADLVWIVEARVLRQDKESGREKILIGA
jgi:phosphate transport system protein